MTCPECDAPLTIAPDVIEGEIIPCPDCGKKFSRSDNLAQHARTHGSGAIVMDLIDNPDVVAASAGFPHPMYSAGPHDDYHQHLGKVLFQVAAEIPGSDTSEDDSLSSGSTKKRKRNE